MPASRVGARRPHGQTGACDFHSSQAAIRGPAPSARKRRWRNAAGGQDTGQRGHWVQPAHRLGAATHRPFGIWLEFPRLDRPGRPVYGGELEPGAGSPRPQAVDRGYISISGAGPGSDPLERPVFGGESGPRVGRTRPDAVGQRGQEAVIEAAASFRNPPPDG